MMLKLFLVVLPISAFIGILVVMFASTLIEDFRAVREHRRHARHPFAKRLASRNVNVHHPIQHERRASPSDAHQGRSRSFTL